MKMGRGSVVGRCGAGVRACGFQSCPAQQPRVTSLAPPLGLLGGPPPRPNAPPPHGPPLPTELGEDVQQLAGHDAASSAEVHGPRETRARLTPESFNSLNPSSPTTSPIHRNICPSLSGNSLPSLRHGPVPGVARVEERGLQESGWEDQNVVRDGVVSAEPPRGHLPPAGRAHRGAGSIGSITHRLPPPRRTQRPNCRRRSRFRAPGWLPGASRMDSSGTRGACLPGAHTCVEGKAARSRGRSWLGGRGRRSGRTAGSWARGVSGRTREMATAHAQRRAPAGASAPRPTGPDAGLAPAHRSAARRASRESAHRRTRSRAARAGACARPGKVPLFHRQDPQCGRTFTRRAQPAPGKEGGGWDRSARADCPPLAWVGAEEVGD